jgi:hypothetical protein
VRETVQALDTLKRWRNTSAAAAAVAAASLPLAISTHKLFAAGIASAVLVGAVLALISHGLCDVRLTTLVAHPAFADVPAVARKGHRLVRVRNRRALAQALLRTARPTQPPARYDACPVLRDRVAPLRSELIALAFELEHAEDPDPASVSLIHELLHDGASPLYNANRPAADVQRTLDRARAGLTAQEPSDWNGYVPALLCERRRAHSLLHLYRKGGA